MWCSGYLCWLLMVVLVLGRAAESETAVPASQVVPAFDVVEDRAVRGGTGWPALGVDQFSFDCREERLGQRVIPALAGASDRQRHAETLGEAGELVGGVLAAAVGMKDHAGGWSAAGDGLT